jgi:hypothetical protein
MNSVQAPSAPMPLSLGAILDAWRRTTRDEWIAASVFGAAVFLMHLMLWGLKSTAPWGSRGLTSPPSEQLVLDAVGAVALLLAVVVADRVTGRDAHRRAVYILAVVIGAVTAAALDSMALNIFWDRWEPVFADPSTDHASGFIVFRFGHTFYLFFEWLTLGGLATFVYIDRRRAQSEVARLHRLEVARARTAKHVLASRLQAMQARVEPQFLFNTLAQVKRLYETDVGLAEQMLGDLIAYLRAAMPRMRDTTSTVAQEIALARAYLDIVKVRLGDRLTVEFAIPENVADARMPPMMLLPLIDHAIAHGLWPPQNRGTIRIGVDIRSGRLRLLIIDSGAGFIPEADGDGIASIRERLAALYGDDATLDLKRGEAESTHAVMVIPYEARPHIDDDTGGAAIRRHENREAS